MDLFRHVFGDCPFNGIVGAIDIWYFLIIRIVQINDLGDYVLIGIVLKIVFTGWQ